MGFFYGIALLFICTVVEMNQPSVKVAILGLCLGIGIGISNIVLSFIPHTLTPLDQLLQKDYILSSLLGVALGVAIFPFVGISVLKAIELNFFVFVLAFSIPAAVVWATGARNIPVRKRHV
jgi:hypothetical protein